jgi:hypothetical protein
VRSKRFSKAAEGEIAGAAAADFCDRKGDGGRRRAAGDAEMGPAELSDARDQKRQHDPDRPGEVRRQPIRDLCQTDLVETFRRLYPTEFSYGGNRCIFFEAADKPPDAAMRHCVTLALTYHLNRRKTARAK